jgi:23S rRNA (cytidine1920-2'-O)/16S rRNA (cytidine1409-2'-O)-methyltransferase
MKSRLDQTMAVRGMVATRSQAESYIKLGKVTVDGAAVTKPGHMVGEAADIKLLAEEQYVSRAALKLASVAETLHVSFRDKVVLDVGSSTGGFTQYALKQGARKVIAVEVGKDQLHPSLRGEPRIELYEQTDVRELGTKIPVDKPDVVVADVSFVSLREILPHVATLCGPRTEIVAMVKPQFEAAVSSSTKSLKHKGVIKNDKMRRDILKDFEIWASGRFVVGAKADSHVAGARGNLERFYLLRLPG